MLVAVLGLTAYARPGSHLPPNTREPGDACGCVVGDGVEGECCDRQDVRLPGAQLQLLQQLAAGHVAKQPKQPKQPPPPLVLVSVNAGMLDLEWAKAELRVGAIVLAPYLGMQVKPSLLSLVLSLRSSLV